MKIILILTLIMSFNCLAQKTISSHKLNCRLNELSDYDKQLIAEITVKEFHKGYKQVHVSFAKYDQKYYVFLAKVSFSKYYGDLGNAIIAQVQSAIIPQEIGERYFNRTFSTNDATEESVFVLRELAQLEPNSQKIINSILIESSVLNNGMTISNYQQIENFKEIGLNCSLIKSN